MRALVVAIIYFGSFLMLGLIAKLVIGRLMVRRDLDLDSVRAQTAPNRRKRRAFLLGFWRDEDPDL